jgi:hypothetical protein
LNKKFKDIMYRAMFMAGWLLSPLTTWNDILINIPLAYIMARAFKALVGLDMAILTVVFYWITNIAGLGMMYFGARRIAAESKIPRKSLLSVIIPMIVYSVIIIIIDRWGRGRFW